MYQFFLQSNIVALLTTIVLTAYATYSFISLIKDTEISHVTIHAYVNRLNQNGYLYYFLHKWIICGECMSYVHSILPSIAISYSMRDNFTSNYFVNIATFIVIWLTIQRLSNLFHDIHNLVRRGRVLAIEMLKSEEQTSE